MSSRDDYEVDSTMLFRVKGQQVMVEFDDRKGKVTFSSYGEATFDLDIAQRLVVEMAEFLDMRAHIPETFDEEASDE